MAGKTAARRTSGKEPVFNKTADSTAVAGSEVDGNLTRSAGEEIRQSARPVRVDEAGRIFEMSGEPIIMPGLAPENILKGIEDERAGRLRSLEEYIASRDHNGI
jgi:hypothetical protein